MKKNKPAARKRPQASAEESAALPGQNLKMDVGPEQDVYHDENRRNLYDPEVAARLRGRSRKAPARK